MSQHSTTAKALPVSARNEVRATDCQEPSASALLLTHTLLLIPFWLFHPFVTKEAQDADLQGREPMAAMGIDTPTRVAPALFARGRTPLYHVILVLNRPVCGSNAKAASFNPDHHSSEPALQCA